MKNKTMLILALVMLSLAACKKTPDAEPGSEPGSVQEGKNANLKLKIKQSRGLQTYAPGDLNATDAEVTVSRVDVFIFDDGAPYGLIHKFFDQPADIYVDPLDIPNSGLKSLDLLNVKTGKKRIYVAINLTNAVVTRLVDNYAYLTDGITFNSGSAPYNDRLFQHLVGAAATPSSNDASVVMFNTTDFDGTPTNVLTIVENPVSPQNEITVDVSRMVAKVAVKTDAALNLSIPGGTLSNLRFTSGQTNNRLHLAPLRQFRDANWNTFQASDFNLHAIDVGFQPYANGVINPANDAWADFDFELATTPKVYLPENTSQAHRHNEVSYISLRATFTPTDDGEPLGFGTTPTVTGTFPAGTFYAVFSNDVGSVSTPTPGIAVHYFPVLADANAYAATHSGEVLTYTGGFCYYRIYLNPNGNGTTTGNQYDILRNVFYKVNITRINTIGTTLPDHIPGSNGTPGYPGGTVVAENPAVVATDVISPPKNADIVSTITIADWVSVEEDYEF